MFCQDAQPVNYKQVLSEWLEDDYDGYVQLIHIIIIMLQTNLLYAARISWVLVLFADIPYLHEIFIV